MPTGFSWLRSLQKQTIAARADWPGGLEAWRTSRDSVLMSVITAKHGSRFQWAPPALTSFLPRRWRSHHTIHMPLFPLCLSGESTGKSCWVANTQWVAQSKKKTVCSKPSTLIIKFIAGLKEHRLYRINELCQLQNFWQMEQKKKQPWMLGMIFTSFEGDISTMNILKWWKKLLCKVDLAFSSIFLWNNYFKHNSSSEDQ